MVEITTEISLGPAIVEDAAEIARVHVESWRTTYAGILPEEILLNLSSNQHEARWWCSVLGRFRRNHFVYLAEAGESEVASFCSAGPSQHPSVPYQAEVYTLYLRDEFHGVGAGRQFFESTLAAVGEVRGPSVIVWCLVGNPSRYFYEAMGGSLVARRPSKVGTANVEEVGYAWNDTAKLAVSGSS